MLTFTHQSKAMCPKKTPLSYTYINISINSDNLKKLHDNIVCFMALDSDSDEP